MREAFLVVGYTNSFEKDEALENLLVKLKEKNIPIFLVLHNIPNRKILDLVDYFLYDKENPSLYNYKDTHQYNFIKMSTNETLQTSLDISNYTNHGLAALRMMWLGLYNLKGLGFDKCHCIEYDTHISSMDEIDKNFKLLDNYDTIAYNGFDVNNRELMILIQFMAFNLNSFSYEELEFSPKTETKIRQCFLDNPSFNGMAELVLSSLLMSSKKYLFKNHKILDNEDFIIDLSNKTPFKGTQSLYSAFPYWDVDNNCVKLSLANKSNKDILFEVYVNGTQIYIPVKVSPKSWSTQELFVSLEEIITISFSVDKKHICSYNLRNDLTYEKFKLVSTTTKGNDYVYSQLTAVVK
jgi:hypothetical protein|tara:strand:+ start:224 stop:1279 length:1056 start_codon:yes stop_codon:yes gene_type:complete